MNRQDTVSMNVLTFAASRTKYGQIKAIVIDIAGNNEPGTGDLAGYEVLN